MVFQIFRAEKTQVPEVKASAAAPVVSFHGSGRAAWSSRDTSSLIRNGFTNNPVGFRCVKMIAEAAAAVPLVLQDATQRYDTHPILRVLSAPNETQDLTALLESFIGQLMLTGDGYLEAAGVDEETGAPTQLYVLRSDRMKVVPGADGWPVAYEYAVGARKHRFDMRGLHQPILHLKTFHPTDDHYGFAPLMGYAPAHLRVQGVGSGELAISWVRRTRIDGDNWAGVDVPLGEDSESYLVTVMSGGSVLRTETVTAPNWTYSGADQLIDGATLPLEIRVAQLSVQFGPGPFERITYNG